MLWSPQPKQTELLTCPATEIFYGGAAGGGKSDGLLMKAFQNIYEYGRNAKAIIFRRAYGELAELFRRADELFIPVGAKYKSNSKFGPNIYFFPNGGQLQLTYLRKDTDVTIYQGSQYTFVGFDELGNYPTDYAWEYMQSRLRSAKGARSLIVGTGNPGGVGQGWIKKRFMDGRLADHIYKREVKLRNGSVQEFTSVYIPSTLYDNPELIKNDPNYEAKLLMLPQYLREALLNGSWDVFAGQVFSVFKRQTHVREHFLLDPRYWYKFCSMDWGFSKPYDLQWWAVNREGQCYMYREMYGCKDDSRNVGLRKGSDELAKEAWNVALTEGVTTIVADPAMWGKSDNAPCVAENFEKAGWKMIPANNDRVSGLVLFNQMLTNTDENGVPMLTVAPECQGFIDTIPLLTPDPNHQEDIDTKLEDHPYDAARYAMMSDFVQNPQRYVGMERRSGNVKYVDDYNPLE